jgi:hypothetical protein
MRDDRAPDARDWLAAIQGGIDQAMDNLPVSGGAAAIVAVHGRTAQPCAVSVWRVPSVALELLELMLPTECAAASPARRFPIKKGA